MNVPTKYAQNPKSMLQYEYKSVYFVCRKPKFSLAIAQILSETDMNENGLHFPVDEEENDAKGSDSDIDDHDAEETN